MATPEITNASSKDASDALVTIENVVDQAKRAFALKKYEEAVEHYATALELMTKKHGESASEMADLYFSYGKALLENAIAQSSVLGKDQPEEEEDDHPVAGPSSGQDGPILSFSGDADDDAVDLFEHAQQTIDEAEKEAAEEEEEAEPEDDFNAAWEVLDLARAIYDKQKEDDEVRLKLADTYIALGDVSLETEKFDQAIADYEAGLALKKKLLPTSSRQIAEAHYKLSMVLDLTSGRLADAITHAEKALESVQCRLAELRDGISGQLPPLHQEDERDKGKGKTTGARLVRDDHVSKMTKSQMEAELKELSGLSEDLALKVEELKTSPAEPGYVSAPALAAQALDKELNAEPSSSTSVPAAVNDLTSMVVKRKKKVPEESHAKRKADSDAEASGSEKRARLDSPSS